MDGYKRELLSSPFFFLPLHIVTLHVPKWFSFGITCSVAKSCPTLCNPHGLQHARLPCPPLSSEVWSNSCLLSQWYYAIISSSAPLPFSFCLPSFPASGSFPMSCHFHISWPKYWSFSSSINPSNEYLGLISFRTDWFDFCVVQGILESTLATQFESVNSSGTHPPLWSNTHIQTWLL